MDRPAGEVVELVLAEFAVEDINRLAPPPNIASDDDVGLLSHNDLMMLKDAHCRDIAEGRPDDGVYFRAVFHRERIRHERDGKSPEVARGLAKDEAARVLNKLTKNVIEQLKGLRGAEAERRQSRREVVLEPMALHALMRLFYREWQQRKFDLWKRIPDGDPVKINPLGREIFWSAGPKQFQVVVGPRGGDPSSSDEDVSRDPYMTEEGYRCFRESVVSLIKPASASAKRPPSREKPFWPAAKNIGMKWLEDNGCPQKGDGNQAQLEEHIADWLSDRGHDAGETTIRRHVNDWIEEFRDRIAM